MMAIERYRMNTELIEYPDFNIASVGVTTLFDGRNFGLCYDTQPCVKLTTPPMVAPFPVSEYINKDRKSFTLTLGFNGYQTNCELETMKRLFESLDDLMIELAIKHASTWFKSCRLNKPLSRQKIQEMYKPILKPANNPNYPPSVRIKLKQLDNQINSRVSFVKTNGTATAFSLDEFTPGSKVSVYIKLSNIWVVNNTFGITLEGEDVFVHEPKLERAPVYSFAQDD